MGLGEVRPQRATSDWREAEVVTLTAQLAQLDVWLSWLDDVEAMLGEEDDAGHTARALAASLRCCRDTRTRRVELLRAALHELAVEARA